MIWKTPPVVKSLLMINSAFFFFFNIFLFSSGGMGAVENVFSMLGLVPADFLSGSWWQPITSMFLHAGVLHLFMNMLALWSIGALLENTIGGRRFLQLYLFSGLIGAIFVVLFQHDISIPTIGASGAITGLLGALALLQPNTRLLFFIFPVRARTAALFLGFFSLMLAFFSRDSQISHLGHLGGLVGGFLFVGLARLFAGERSFTAERTRDEPVKQADGMSGLSPRRRVRERVIFFDPYTGRFYTR